MFEVPLGDFLDRVGQEPTPGGGAGAALSIAMAAGLVEMASRGSPDWVDAGATIEAAQQYRFAVTRLAPVNAGAYATARSARARTAETGPDDAAHADLI